MEVASRIRSSRPILLAACLTLSGGGRALADPMYTAIDLGTGSPTFGVDSSGNGTVTGSNGLTYTFNPVQNVLPAQWANTSQGVPIVTPAPVGNTDTFGDPNFAYSNSTLKFMNSQGLAVGIDVSGVSGHWNQSTTFLTQQQPDGSWGAPTALWSGSNVFDGGLGNHDVGILGITSSGQVLGTGPEHPNADAGNSLYLYDAKSHNLTDLSDLVDSMKWTNATQLPFGQTPNWIVGAPVAQLDDRGRILLQEVGQGVAGPGVQLLLVPEGISPDPIPAPEPATWAILATLLGGWLVRRRLRSRNAAGSTR